MEWKCSDGAYVANKLASELLFINIQALNPRLLQALISPPPSDRIPAQLLSACKYEILVKKNKKVSSRLHGEAHLRGCAAFDDGPRRGGGEGGEGKAPAALRIHKRTLRKAVRKELLGHLDQRH